MTTQAAESFGVVTRVLHPAITTDAGCFEAAARAAERVEVQLQSPGPESRSKLSALVLSSIEAQLERLGAAPRGWTARDSLEMVLSDQLYRSRLLGAGGIALKLGALDGIADAEGGLSLEDSHALRRMFALAEIEPLQVFLPEPSAHLGVLGAPQRLSDWLPPGARTGRVASIEYAAAEPDGAPAADPASLAPPQLDAFVRGLERADTAAESSAPQPGVPASAGEPDEHERPTVVPKVLPTDCAVAATANAAVAAPAPEPALALPQEPAVTPAPKPAAAPAPDLQPAVGGPDGAAVEATRREDQQRRCAAWLTQLQSMQGPKQHASIERAFLTAYLPLAREVATGKVPQEFRSAVESWAEGFAHGYASAFKTLTTHARRPTMVRDIFDVGQRWLNQYRARNFQVLLVDSMRCDLGQRLNELLERRLAGQAVCRDQALLWAALPSNAGAQRLGETGPSRSPQTAALPPAATPGPAAAGAVETLRIGSRELFRVDQLSADLAKAGEPEPQRLERLAALLADAVVPWLKARAPDTLVVVFGDHGFHWQAGAQGTSAAQRGGALPEQVLVPASAWLLSTTRQKAGLAPGLH
jgi:hypothetical protein